MTATSQSLEQGTTTMKRKRKGSDGIVHASCSVLTRSSALMCNFPPALAATERRFRELYAQPPDFKDLSRRDANFAAFVKGRELDFRDPDAVMQLTKTLLDLDFGIKLVLPHDRLCPAVPSRHNYILWLKDLLDTSSYDQPGQKLTGLDIGTGASCIYPLLGCAQRPWSFIATDVDAESLEWARKNVQLNDVTGRVTVVSRRPEQPLIPVEELYAPVTFTMTNPPFYESEEDLIRSAEKKQRPPYTACTGSATEMVTPGGELAFVERILRESIVLGGRIQWYTAMFGFLSSLTAFIDKLAHAAITNYAVTEFVQGNKTRRWAVAWSFRPMRPAQAVARGTRAALSKNILPVLSEAEVFVVKDMSMDVVGSFVASIVAAIEALHLESWEWNREAYEGVGRAPGKVWARAWRRREKRAQHAQAQGAEDSIFGFRVWIHVSSTRKVSAGCRWIEGFDATAFESFQGFLKATAKGAAETLMA